MKRCRNGKRRKSNGTLSLSTKRNRTSATSTSTRMASTDETSHSLYPLNRFFHANNLRCTRFLHSLAQRLGDTLEKKTTPADASEEILDEEAIARLKQESSATAISRLRRRVEAELNRLTRLAHFKKDEKAKDEKVGEEIEETENSPQINANWNYDEADKINGPASWSLADSQLQSPIDLPIRSAPIVDLGDDKLSLSNYVTLIAGHFFNNGRSVQFLPDETPASDMPEISGGRLDQVYRFIQYHYHWSLDNHKGSEHSVDRKFYAAELHLVHQGVLDTSKLAVLAVLLRETTPTTPTSNHEAFQAEESTLFRIHHNDQRALAPSQRLIDKLPARRGFARYAGSLTTPPCTENVTWTVFIESVPITTKALALLRSTIGADGRPIACNCRPLQKANNRNIFSTFS